MTKKCYKAFSDGCHQRLGIVELVSSLKCFKVKVIKLWLIKSYNSKADYNAAVKPTTESQVSMIETTREIIVDGVNVVTTQPTVGDVVPSTTRTRLST